jgi:hypothetical protein
MLNGFVVGKLPGKSGRQNVPRRAVKLTLLRIGAATTPHPIGRELIRQIPNY